MSNFKKTIESLSQKHNITQLFDDFMMMSICALSVGKMEDKYRQIAEKYTPEEVEILGNSLGHLLNEYENLREKGWDDILGKFFMETNSGRSASANGQFFTPIHICNLMVNALKDDSLGTVNDPSCGSGRNLIAHAHSNKNGLVKRFYVGMDLDKRCVNMTALNMFFYSMDGLVIHMDSIFFEIFSGYRIHLPHTYKGIQYLTKEECEAYLFEIKKI